MLKLKRIIEKSLNPSGNASRAYTLWKYLMDNGPKTRKDIYTDLNPSYATVLASYIRDRLITLDNSSGLYSANPEYKFDDVKTDNEPTSLKANIRPQRFNSLKDFNQFSGTSVDKASSFVNKLVSNIPEWKKYLFEIFYSGYSGFTIYDNDMNKIGYLIYDDNEYGLEDAIQGKGWYLRKGDTLPKNISNKDWDKWVQIVKRIADDPNLKPRKVHM